MRRANILAEAVRSGFGPQFTEAASVLADMLDRWHSSDSPDPGTMDGIAGKSRDELLRMMAVIFMAALRETKRLNDQPGKQPALKTMRLIERDFDHGWVEQVMMKLAEMPDVEGLLFGYEPNESVLYQVLADMKAKASAKDSN